MATHECLNEEILMRFSILAAVLMVSGGVVLVATLTIDYVSASGFWTLVFTQGLGFLLVFAGSLLARPVVDQWWGWSAFVLGAGGWLFCWSWFLHLGLVLPIPLVFWASLATAALLTSVVIFVVRSKLRAAGVVGALTVGSALSTYVMAMNPIFASDYNYIPFAMGAIVAGIICGVVVMMNRARAAVSAT